MGKSSLPWPSSPPELSRLKTQIITHLTPLILVAASEHAKTSICRNGLHHPAELFVPFCKCTSKCTCHVGSMACMRMKQVSRHGHAYSIGQGFARKVILGGRL